MKFVRYDTDCLGLLTADGTGIIEITDPLGLTTADPLKEYIKGDYDASDFTDDPPDHRIKDVRLEAPIRRPNKVVAAPANYRLHVEEMGGGHEYTQQYFLKAPSSISGPADPIELPFSDRRCDHEVELGFIVADHQRDVDKDDVSDHIFGYTMVLDISMRGDEDRSNRKSYDTFTPVGPTVVTPDEIDDPQDLELTLEVNGEPRQQATTADMVFTCAELVQYASTGATIEAGDVFTTGTPEGVAELNDGDTVRAAVEDLGSMELEVEERDETWDERVLPPR